MNAPIITSAEAAIIRVEVEPYRTTDLRGREVEVHYFERDTGFVSAYGFLVRKDGERGRNRVRLPLGAPFNVTSLMVSLIEPFDAVGEEAGVTA